MYLYSILFYPITLEGRRGTTDEFATIPFHPVLFSAALVELAKSIPVHSLILSSHLFLSASFSISFLSFVQNETIYFVFISKNNPKDLDPSYKTDLDLVRLLRKGRFRLITE